MHAAKQRTEESNTTTGETTQTTRAAKIHMLCSTMNAIFSYCIVNHQLVAKVANVRETFFEITYSDKLK